MYTYNSNGVIYITGKIGSFASFFVSQIKRKTIILYETENEALFGQEEVGFYSGRPAHLFPVYTERVFQKDDDAKRTAFLHHLAQDDDFVGFFPYSSLGQSLLSPQTLPSTIKKIRCGETVFQEDLVSYLDKNGFEKTSLVREIGDYAKRGSIIDVFSPSYDDPLRLEFLGDQILSIRFFNPSTQRSLKEITQCNITHMRKPAVDGVTTLLDYIDENMALVHRGVSVIHAYLPISDDSLKKRWATILGGLLDIDISGISSDPGTIINAYSNDDLKSHFQTKQTEVFKTLTEKLKNEWSTYKYVYIFAHSERQALRLQEIFYNYDIHLPILSHLSVTSKINEWGVVTGPVRRGFRTDNIVILTEEDIVGPKKQSTKKKWNSTKEFLDSFRDLSIGEWVVHVDHGIGVYKGISPLNINGMVNDYLLIEYQDGDKLYVPVSDLHLVQKFIGSDKIKPKIDRLGSPIWRNTKRRVKKQIEDIAEELISIHAERQLAEGHSYPPDDELFREMESGFAYEETEGQLKAIEDVLNDLNNTKPMDRLVCGDVGFGKTEVAIRASFKVVLDNKQVAILVPTTILAQQHFKTFRERLKDYPVTVEMLSRFRSGEEQKRIIEYVGNGKIDIIIGTHRLIQKDISFRDLGLLIIDEEQRFGVKHKEKLKLLKKNIDVLTLSATPIPRTLHMATMGIKDLSIINTPPLDRLAVKTFVVQFGDEIIQKAVSEELARGGQVFFVHNYIHNIGVVYDHLVRLLPHSKIAVAHGQMDGKKLEKIMFDFIDKKYDVLLSTNIVESGLDIPNANTIVINNAHRIGLADLYQLRGRVGRGEKQAYAYLLVPKNDTLTRDAVLRLKIIEEMTDLGAGFHIANHDLEIRGAGNLLGKEQSGNVNLIGFELYCEMLEYAVRRLKDTGKPVEEKITTEINIPVNAFIPDSYIQDPGQKLLTYKRLSGLQNDEEVVSITEELRDRYGAIPQPLSRLIEVVSLRSFLSSLYIKKIEHSAGQTTFYITDQTPLDMSRLLSLTAYPGKKLKLLPDGRILFKSDAKMEHLIPAIKNLLMEIVTL